MVDKAPSVRPPLATVTVRLEPALLLEPEPTALPLIVATLIEAGCEPASTPTSVPEIVPVPAPEVGPPVTCPGVVAPWLKVTLPVPADMCPPLPIFICSMLVEPLPLLFILMAPFAVVIEPVPVRFNVGVVKVLVAVVVDVVIALPVGTLMAL